MIRQITNNECLKGNATRISQCISILVSRDPCCCLSSKKLVWLNFLLKFQVFKFSYAIAFFKNFQTLPMICKLSPVEVSLFQRKKRPPNRKRLLFGVWVAKGKKVFCRLFDIEDTGSMVKSRFHQISPSNAFSNLIRIKIKS